MFYTVYKITNLVNNKIYIGVHKTSNLEDNYMGSGLLIRKAIEKYGIENFKKEYISIFDNAEDMFNMESALVNEDFLERDDVYNLKQGGEGGWDCVNRDKERNKKISERMKHQYKCGFLSPFTKLHKLGLINYNTFKGKTHTEETKKRIGDANSKHQIGEGNSQFGTMWIYNLELKENKKIKKEEFSTWEQDGWIKGRKIK